MINNISWGTYWSVLTILTLLYYVYVILAYYRRDFRNIVGEKSRRFSSEKLNPSTGAIDIALPAENANQQLLLTVQAFIDELIAYIDQCPPTPREELIQNLQRIFQKYKTVYSTYYRGVIESFLLSECETKCAVRLDKHEVCSMWTEETYAFPGSLSP